MTGDWVIIGLGNPGVEHEKNRHNLGFWFLDALAEEMGASFSWENKCSSWVARVKRDGATFFLLKPGTYMNLSGRALAKFLEYFRPNEPRVLAVVDDLDLPVGKMRLRLKGSSGGHNGLKSIQGALHTTEYMRLKIGIGKPETRSTVHYVLSNASKEEEEIYKRLIGEGVKALLQIGKAPFQEIIENINSKQF